MIPRHKGDPSALRAGCCRVLADAFADDPWAAYVLGVSGSRRSGALADLMRVPVALAESRGGVLTHTDADSAVAAVSTWVPADHRSVGMADAARANALILPLRIGPATMLRLNRDEAALGDLITAHLLTDAPTHQRGGGERDPVDPAVSVEASATAYLWVLGVARRHHGQGLGRVVVEKTCNQARSRGYRRLVLNTDNPDNVPIYRKLGFELVSTTTRPSGLVAHLLDRPL